MKSIITRSGAFVTGAEIADAVMAYGLALARIGALDVVDIPFVASNGSVGRVQLRIGWKIETAVTSDEQPTDELIEIDTIFGLLAKARSVAQSRPTDGSRRWTEAWDDTNWDELI